ncbi:MAG: hypothetical protein R3B84_20840 [Zavarzinella sp.]
MIRDNKIRYVKAEDVDYVIADFERSNSPLDNLIPLKRQAYAQRTSMASRKTTQAMAFKDAEAPAGTQSR